MSHKPGDTLGPYEILAPLGAGGMGEVYKARDTRLERLVAVKVLPDHIARREDLRARFEREARAVASLNHPHICVLFDIGPNYMVMELIEGETLEARVARGALPLETALAYAGQIADALDRAHRTGVTHRDIKPGNIMLTRDGVKVLDFGLAKSAAAKPGPADATVVAALTTEGTVLGTPQYMAPEQFEGKEADARADIWAFGAVLYEMVTGRKAFEGKNYTSLVAAILGGEPAPMAVKPFTPAWLERMVRRCLEKDAEDRWQSMRDIVLELRSPPVEAAGKGKASKWPWAVAGVCLLLGGLAWLPSLRQPAVAPPPPIVFQLEPPEGGGGISYGMPSPDGRALAVYVYGGSAPGTYVREFASKEFRFLRRGRLLTWTPDSRSVLVNDEGRLVQVDIEGGSPQTIANVTLALTASDAGWTAGGDLVYGARDGELRLWRRDVGDTAALTKPGPRERHASPQVFDAGKRVLYRISGRPGWYMREVGAPPEQPGRGPISLPEVGGPFEGKSKWWIYIEDRRLLARRIREPDWRLEGPAVTIADVPGGFYWESNGILVTTAQSGRPTHAGWFDRTGRLVEKVVEGQTMGFGGALSPDGKRLALPDVSSKDLWITDLDRKNRMRLTFDGKETAQPVWSPDGAVIVFAQDRTLYSKPANGAGQLERLSGIEGRGYPTDWSRDGKYLLFYQIANNGDIYLLPITGGARNAVALEASPHGEYVARFSPDSRWISYVSEESGRSEIYVRDFTGSPANARGKWLISNGGGNWHRWRDDGREIFYINGQSVMSVEVDGRGAAFAAASPKKLFDAAAGVSIAGVSRDGQRLLLLYPEKPVGYGLATVILNLESLLTREVSAGR